MTDMEQTTETKTSVQNLEGARALALPQREDMLRRAPSVQQFWTENRTLLADAWAEWEAAEASGSDILDSSLIDPDLRTAVNNAWNDPTTESAVAELVHEAAPGVYAFQFFDPNRLADLRGYFEDPWVKQSRRSRSSQERR